MQNGLFRKERKLCTKPWEKTEIKSNKSVKKCDTNKQTNKQNAQYWGRISRTDIAPVFCGCSARRKIIFSNGSEITCFDFYLNPVTKITFTFDLPRHKETQPSTSISVSRKIVSHFLREVAVKLQQKNALDNVIYSWDVRRNFKSRSTSSHTNKSKALSLAAGPKSLRTGVQ